MQKFPIMLHMCNLNARTVCVWLFSLCIRVLAIIPLRRLLLRAMQKIKLLVNEIGPQQILLDLG